jgi:hypothetical protein
MLDALVASAARHSRRSIVLSNFTGASLRNCTRALQVVLRYRNLMAVEHSFKIANTDPRST